MAIYNPVRAGIVMQAKDYSWSWREGYFGVRPQNNFILGGKICDLRYLLLGAGKCRKNAIRIKCYYGNSIAA